MAPMQAVRPRVGYSDLLAMPEDGRRYEIHGGDSSWSRRRCRATR